MSKLTGIHYYVIICMWIWMAYTRRCSAEANYEALSHNPLDGSAQRWPRPSAGWQANGGGIYKNEELTRLLDVGAKSSENDLSSISFVPPLDRSSPSATLSQDQFAMQFVLFDLQLVELKSVDSVGGSFEVEIQMVLHWIDSIVKGSFGTDDLDKCRFPCDTKSRSRCCDEVWVPPFHLSNCEIKNIKSSIPEPNAYNWFGPSPILFSDCLKKENEGECFWRRLWYLNIDARCESDMDFHTFPFDKQRLTIEILNPYASRTWFQLTKGFLEANFGEDTKIVNLSSGSNIPGWHLENFTMLGTCGITNNWRQTFLAQNHLLKTLNATYASQEYDILKALDRESLKCSIMEDLNNGSNGIDDFNLASYGLYKDVSKNYAERVTATLETYRQCTKDHGKAFYWNLSSDLKDGTISVPNFGSFDTSANNINRSFNILDLNYKQDMANVSFTCAISAIANLTTPGIQVTIVVRRYRLFYVVKLLLPTFACVLFSFAAFGLQPKDLVGRLTVVVPSAIALTALQSFVVSTDLPPMLYIAPSTYIFLFSYLAQILISFESILVSWLYYRSGFWKTRGTSMSKRRVPYAASMEEVSAHPYQGFDNEENRGTKERSQNIQPAHDMSFKLPFKNITQENFARIESQLAPQEDTPKIEGGSAPQETNEVSREASHRCSSYTRLKMDCVRVVDLLLMTFICMLYIGATLYCTICPLNSLESFNKKNKNNNAIGLWK